jgi:hypothetical protein
VTKRRFTFSERNFPETGEFTSLARQWNKGAIEILFGLVWRGYDLLWAEVLCQASWTDVADDIERDLTEQLEPRIRRNMTGFEPFEVQCCRRERETRCAAPAAPPEYDIAFYLRERPLVNFPLEAKVLRTDQALAAYVADVKNEFLTCRYAPFSAEGAMLGYLLKGAPAAVFAKIARDVPCQLHQHEEFPDRAHQFSDHQRKVEPGKTYPVAFRCHHLILRLTV